MNLASRYQEACREPSDIGGLLTILHRHAAECRRVTEFGVRSGNSTAALLAARPAVYRGYDLEAHEAHDRLIDAARRNGTDAVIHYQDTSRLEDIEETDLLFIDTLHTAEQVEVELRHAGRVRRYILFHDTVTFGRHGERPGSRGILYAVESSLGASPDWVLKEEHTHTNGMQVWARVDSRS